MEFGLVLSQFGTRWEHLVGDAVRAEEEGLDSVWLADHLLNTADPGGDVFEAWTALAAVAGATTRIRLGHLVNCVSFRNVGVLAKMAATLDHASGGRLELGLGAGWYEQEYRAFGFDFPDPGARRRAFEEILDALVQLFTGEPVDFEGDYVRLAGAVCRPVPLQQPHPPLVVGTGGMMMRRITGRKADVWNCPARLLPELDEARAVVMGAAAGRLVRTTIQVPVAVGRTADEAAAAREVGRTHLAWMGDLDEVGIVGTIDAAAAQIAAYAARGVDGLTAVLPGSRARPDFIAAFAEVKRAMG